MGIDIDWSLAKPRETPFNALAAGYESGRAMGRQRRADNALSAFAANPADPQAAHALMIADPQTYAAVEDVRYKQSERERSARAREAAGSYIAQTIGRGGSSASTAAAQGPSLAGPAPAPAPVSVDGAPVAFPAAGTAGLPANGYLARLAQDDPDTAIKLHEVVTKADDATRKRLIEGWDALATASIRLGRVPLERRSAAAQRMAPMLSVHGVTPEMIATADLSDDGLAGVREQALGLKDSFAQADRDRTFNETVRTHRASEGISAGNLAVSQANLELSEQRLGLDRERIKDDRNRPSPSDVVGPILAKVSAGVRLTPAENSALNYYKADPLSFQSRDFTQGNAFAPVSPALNARGRTPVPPSPAPRIRPPAPQGQRRFSKTATSLDGKQRIGLDQSGKWVDIETGRPYEAGR